MYQYVCDCASQRNFHKKIKFKIDYANCKHGNIISKDVIGDII
jgi:hypothetical protein